MKCEVHEWYWDISDHMGCPICHGEKLERERIIKLLEETDLLRTIEGGSLVNYAEDAIALIKGENK